MSGSYLNSNVSLISKASIRYEGTLFSINPQEATITLANVKSYGTENRKVDKFLAPKDTLFEYIIFKANDIKELIVDEPLDDPAIVTATQAQTSSSNNAAFSGFNPETQQNTQANGLSSEAQATLSSLTGNVNKASAPGVSSAGQGGDRFRSRGSTPSSIQAGSPVSELNANRTKNDSNKGQARNSDNSHSNGGYQNQYQQRRGWEQNNRNNNSNYQPRNNQQQQRYNNNNNNNQMNRRPGGYNNNNNHNNNNHTGYQNNRNVQNQNYRRNDERISTHLNNRNTGGYRSNYNNAGNNYSQQNRGNNMQMMRGNRKFAPQSNKKHFDASLKTEFDFEKAQEAFQQVVDKLDDLNLSVNGDKSEKSGSEDATKEDTRTELEKGEKGEEADNCYDKTKSFFDKISCEAIERTKGNQKRFDWKQERKLNAETFGIKVTYRPNGYRRPGGFTNTRNGNRSHNYSNNNTRNSLPPRSNALRTDSS